MTLPQKVIKALSLEKMTEIYKIDSTLTFLEVNLVTIDQQGVYLMGEIPKTATHYYQGLKRRDKDKEHYPVVFFNNI